MAIELDREAGKALKREGQDLAEASEETFCMIMRQHAKEISDKSGFVTSDNLRVIADELGLVPKSQNSWGSIFRGPRWKIVGRTKSAIPSNHDREIKVWRYEERR